jgi:hypothetical protein
VRQRWYTTPPVLCLRGVESEHACRIEQSSSRTQSLICLFYIPIQLLWAADDAWLPTYRTPHRNPKLRGKRLPFSGQKLISLKKGWSTAASITLLAWQGSLDRHHHHASSLPLRNGSNPVDDGRSPAML